MHDHRRHDAIADMIITDIWSSAEAVPPRRLGDGDLIKVRFGALSGLKPDISRGPLRAMCGRLQVGKENLHVAGLVGAAMCSAFECGSHDRWP